MEEKSPHNPGRLGSVATLASLDEALGQLDISTKDADEAFAFLRDHPNAVEIREEAVAILSDPKLTKKLLRKIDFTIIPCMIAVYFLQFLDKTTISYAAIMGLRTDTHLKGQDYSNIAMMFYIGYLVAEFPTQYLAQRISRLGKYLGVNVMCWGVVLSCMAATTSYAGLMVCRVLLGIFEAPVAPILVLIIAMWYKKGEQGRRVSYFYVCNSITQIFGSGIAYGASFTKGKFASWRIFFLIIGLMTILFGGLVATFLPDSPVKAMRFTDAEKVAALLRVKENQSGTQNAKIKKEQVIESLKDVRVWLVFLSVLLTSIPNGGLSNFSSILLTTFGYSSQQALILGMPGGAVGIFIVLLSGYLSDKWNDRSLVMLICLIPTIIAAGLMYGLDPTGVPHNKGALLFASYLSGTFGAAFMLLLAWNASNLAGHSKKVTCNALTLVGFCLGNILGTQTFQQSEAPGYKSGKIAIVACLTAQVCVCFVLRYCNDRLNKKNREALASMSEEDKSLAREKLAYSDETDRRNPFFMYTH
ncbi:MFS transporter [Exophiala viscosa]|uniref:MFS transporter n=1 Tax=Exophiala viscosa TaxID=2486360 RepID=A0AAN6DU85_9EURO|nr:MFS transporter [Exophiala viscosa]KAI1625729.1 MFS transporter [Exophiala viscosa]